MGKQTRNQSAKKKSKLSEDLFQAIKTVVKDKGTNNFLEDNSVSGNVSEATLEEEQLGEKDTKGKRTRRSKYSKELKKIEQSCLRQLIFSFGIFKSQKLAELLTLAFPTSNSDFSFKSVQEASVNVIRRALCEVYIGNATEEITLASVSGKDLLMVCEMKKWVQLSSNQFNLIDESKVYKFKSISTKYSFPNAESFLEIVNGFLSLMNKLADTETKAKVREQAPYLSPKVEEILLGQASVKWNLNLVFTQTHQPLPRLDSNWDSKLDVILLKAAFEYGNFCAKKFCESEKNILDPVKVNWPNKVLVAGLPKVSVLRKRVKEILKGIAKKEINFVLDAEIDEKHPKKIKTEGDNASMEQDPLKLIEKYRIILNNRTEIVTEDDICYLYICLKRYGCPSVKDVQETKGNLTWKDFKSHLRNASNKSFESLSEDKLKLYAHAIIRKASLIADEHINESLFFAAESTNLGDINFVDSQLSHLNISINMATELLRNIEFLYIVRHSVLPETLVDFSGKVFDFNQKMLEIHRSHFTFTWWVNNPEMDFAAFACLALNGCSQAALKNVTSTFSLNPVVHTVLSSLSVHEQQEFASIGINFSRLYQLAKFFKTYPNHFDYTGAPKTLKQSKKASKLIILST